MIRGLTVLLLSLAPVAFAQEPEPVQPVVRVSLVPETVAVGEAARLEVDVLVPTWMPKPPVFPSFEVPNAIVRLPPDRSRPVSDTVNGERWSGVARFYEVYPLLGATYRLGGGTMRVTFANPGAAPVSAEVPLPEVALTATVPVGAEGLDPYLSGAGLTLRREFTGATEGLEVGDAVVMTISAELDGLPALFLPALTPVLDSPLATVYADEPTFENGPPARRSERTTLILDHGGELQLPSVALDWWNRDTGTIETATLEAVTLSVIGPPPPPPEAPEPEDPPGVDWRSVAPVLVVLLLAVALLRKALPVLRERRRAARLAREQSEDYAYRGLQHALRHGDPTDAYEALQAWCRRLEGVDGLETLAERFGDDPLRAELLALSRSLYGDVRASCDLRRLGDALGRARKRYLDSVQVQDASFVPALNP